MEEEDDDEAVAAVMVVGLFSEEVVVCVAAARWILLVLVEARKALDGVEIRRTENRTRTARKQLPVPVGMAYPSYSCVCVYGYV